MLPFFTQSPIRARTSPVCCARRARLRAALVRHRRRTRSTITHATTVRRHPHRRRRRHGRRPACHVGQPHQPPHDREGLPRRSLVGCGHRRRRRSGDGDGQALPAPARALREGRGPPPQPRGQGQPAQRDGPQPPPRRHAGHGGRAALRRLRPQPGVGRLFEFDVTGGRYEELHHAATGSGSLHAGTVVKIGYRAGHRPAPTPSIWPSGPCSRRPTTTRPPAAPTSSGASSRSSPPSTSTGSPGSTTTNPQPLRALRRLVLGTSTPADAATGREVRRDEPPRSTSPPNR